MSKTKVTLALLLVVLLGTFFRLYLIGSLPGGLFPDEAANGLDINLMEQGQLQPFYERGNGREALFFYWQWVWVKAFGRTPLAHHTASALVGIFTLIATYLATKKLWDYKFSDPTKSRIVALLSTFFLAVSTWHIVLARTAFRANLIPLFAALTIWTFLGIPKATYLKNKILWAVFAGIFFALGFYTYIAFRIMVPFVGILVLWGLFSSFKEGLGKLARQYTLPLLGLLLAFGIVIAPLAHYFYTHPGSFIGRSGQVSVFNENLNHGDLLGTVLEVTRLSITAYFTEGDLNWRHNISGRPFLSPIISPLFAIGLAVSLLHAILFFFSPRKKKEYFPEFVLIGWFCSLLLPVITTAEGVPHGLRAIGTIPSVFIMSAYGAYLLGKAVWHLAKNYPQGPVWLEKLLQKSLVLLLVVFLVALPIEAAAWYFGVAYNSPENFYSFRSDLTTVSTYLNAHGNRENTYLVLDKFSVQSVDYQTTKDGKTSCDRTPAYRSQNCEDNPINMPYTQVDPERSWMEEGAYYEGVPIWPHGLGKGKKIVFTQSTIFDIAKFKEFHPNSKLIEEQRNKFGQAVLAVYEMQ